MEIVVLCVDCNYELEVMNEYTKDNKVIVEITKECNCSI